MTKHATNGTTLRTTLPSKPSPHQNGHTPKTPKLPFTPEFQARLLLLCLEDGEWLKHLKPSYFDHPLVGQVLTVLKEMTPPVSRRTLAEACAQKLGKNATANAFKQLRKPLDDAERAHMRHVLPRFIRWQMVGESFSEAARRYQSQDVDGLVGLWETLGKPLPTMRQLRLTPVSDVKMQQVDWKWKDRIASGVLHLVVGEPGEGKSAALVDLAARLTRGTSWPDGTPGSGKPEVVVILSAEDMASHTIKPRLLAAGGDPKLVQVFDINDGAYSLAGDLAELERELTKLGASVLILDSVNAFLPGIDLYRMNDTMAALSPWQNLAARLGIAILGITHLTKAGDRNAIQRVMGSVAFAAQARLIFLVAPDPEDVSRKRRLFVPLKNNLGSKAKPLGFTLNTVPVAADGVKADAPKVAWQPIARLVDADALLKQWQRTRPKEIATRVLNRALRKGPIRKKVIERILTAKGVTQATARRAQSELKIEAFQHERKWYWTPPGWTKAQIKQWKSRQSDAHS
jgi:putative DNA primase/helicase